ncbi:hypothetical protein HZR84_08295 [Hyphobacterium sp. CCMP332]|nr:hypothetical protein HZR84_08295 [Hyphobacterium sp. CCMP332]
MSFKARSQDMIINTENDTIVCKIIHLNDQYIQYHFPDSSIQNVLSIARNKTLKIFYADRVIETANGKSNNYIIFQQPEWRADLGFGYSYFLERPLKDFGPDYEKFFASLRNGHSLYAEISKFPDVRFGAGIEFQIGRYSSSIENVIIYDTLLVFQDIGKVEEEVQIFYLQPKGFYAMFSSTWDFVAGGGITLAHLNRNINVLNEKHSFKGESIGIGFSTAIDRKISTGFSIGVRASLNLVMLTTIRKNGKMIELEEGNYFSASQFSLSLGIKYLL